MAYKQVKSTGGKTTKGMSIDKQSVLNSGYGPLSASGLAKKVTSGQLKTSTSGGKISVSRTATKQIPSKKITTSGTSTPTTKMKRTSKPLANTAAKNTSYNRAKVNERKYTV